MYLIFRLTFVEINKGILRGTVQNPLPITVYRSAQALTAVRLNQVRHSFFSHTTRIGAAMKMEE